MRTWLMFRDRNGNLLPTPQYQSKFSIQEYREKRRSRKDSLSGVKKPYKMDPFPAEFYAKELRYLLTGLLFLVTLLYWIAPEIFHYFGL